MKVKEYIDVHLSGDIAKYLSEKAEMKVEEALTEIMFGKPGLLLRGLIRNRNTYHHLTKIVGDIPPLHCKCKSEICQLKDECFDMETDLILLYPNGINIYVIIFEVKKVIGELESFKPVQIACSQLSRDLKLILSLLNDVPAINIITKTFAVLPETNTHHLFCKDCAEFILSKEDFDFGSKHLKQKLFTNEPSLDGQNGELLLKACARITGA